MWKIQRVGSDGDIAMRLFKELQQNFVGDRSSDSPEERFGIPVDNGDKAGYGGEPEEGTKSRHDVSAMLTLATVDVEFERISRRLVDGNSALIDMVMSRGLAGLGRCG